MDERPGHEVLRFGQAAECLGTHLASRSDALAVNGLRPCVVMAHGLGGTADSGLFPVAEELAGAGLDVLVFDYRGFGRSGGGPRQTLSVRRQLEDYSAAMEAARELPGVDPDRLALWGVSLSAGHVLTLAAQHPRIAAVVALVPLVSGLAAGRLAARQYPAGQLLRSGGRGLRSRVAGALGRDEQMLPIVGPPGSSAAFTLPGAEESYRALAGDSWRNEIAASVAVEVASYRPIAVARHVAVPVLVQIADLDRSAPPATAAKAAFRARAEVRHYPVDHFDVLADPWRDTVVRHQVSFLSRHLARPAVTAAPGASEPDRPLVETR